MNCRQTRFFLYAYLDRDISAIEAEALSRHLAECESCEVRSRSAKGLARILHSRRDRATAPSRLRNRIQNGGALPVRHRSPVFAMAAAVVILVLPVVADGPGRGSAAAPPIASPAPNRLALASRRVTLTGTLVCLQCDTRHEAGLCPQPETGHEPGFCSEDGQVWRLMAQEPSLMQASFGQSVTLEGVEFPGSGFLRASRVGY